MAGIFDDSQPWAFNTDYTNTSNSSGVTLGSVLSTLKAIEAKKGLDMPVPIFAVKANLEQFRDACDEMGLPLVEVDGQYWIDGKRVRVLGDQVYIVDQDKLDESWKSQIQSIKYT